MYGCIYIYIYTLFYYIFNDYGGERGGTLIGNGFKVHVLSHILSRFGCEHKGIH